MSISSLIELTGDRLERCRRWIDTAGGCQRHGIPDAVAKQMRLAFTLFALTAGERLGLRAALCLVPKRITKRCEICKPGGETLLWHRRPARQ